MKLPVTKQVRPGLLVRLLNFFFLKEKSGDDGGFFGAILPTISSRISLNAQKSDLQCIIIIIIVSSSLINENVDENV